MRIRSSIGKMHANLLITKDNEVWAYYKCPLTEVNTRNSDKLELYKNKQEQLISSLAKYQDIDIKILPHDFRLEERFEEFSKEYDETLTELSESLEERTIQILEDELKHLTMERMYLGVKISSVSSARNLKEKIVELTDSILAKIVSTGGYILEADDSFIQKYQLIEEMLFQQLGTLSGVRLSEPEMMSLYRYHYIRGTKESLISGGSVMSEYSLTDAILNPNPQPGMVEVKSANGVKYVSLLPIANFKPNLRFNHIVQLSQELSFPVEFHLKGHFEPLKGQGGMQSKKENANKRLKNVAIESMNSGEAEAKKGKLNRFMLRDLEEKIDTKTPILKWLGCFTVYGDSPDECRKRARAVIDLVDTMGVEVVNGLADQMILFHKTLPAEPLLDMKNWLHYTTSEGLSEMMVGVDNRIGDNIGFPIGCVSTLNNVNGKSPEQIARACRKRVFYNPFYASEQVLGKMYDSPHIAITGPTGGGKSFLAKLIFTLSSLMKGKGLYVDPKSEYKKWIMKVIESPYYQKNYPLFVDYLTHYHFVTLNPNKKANYGVLDPICFLVGADAKDTAESIFEQIYDFSLKEDARVDMLRQVKRVIAERESGKKVGLMHVIERMQANGNEEISKSGDALFEIVDGSILQLAFSYGKTKTLDLKAKVTLLEISGLKLPLATDDPDTYSTVQKKSIALMLPLGKFCEQFGKEDYKEHTYIAFDEAWIFTVARGGKEVVESMKKVGRSLNNQLILITQSIRDANTEEESGNFGRIFAFDKEDERELILAHMGLEVTESNIDWLRSMPARHCLYRDLYGRVNRMLVYCPYEEFLELFKTVEESTSGQSEELFAA